MPAETCHELSWTEGQVLTTKTETKLRRWGSVKKVCAMLDGCDREVIYDLIAVGLVRLFVATRSLDLVPFRVQSAGQNEIKLP